MLEHVLPAVTYIVGVPLGLVVLLVLLRRWRPPATSGRRVRRWAVVLLAVAAVVLAWPYLVAAAVVGGGVVLGIRLAPRLPSPPPHPAPHRVQPVVVPRTRRAPSSARSVDDDYWDEVARQEREQRLSDQRDWDDWRFGHRAAPPPGY